MKKKLRTWLAGVSSAFPTAFSPYWRTLPLGRMKMFLAGYFFVGAAGGFAFDLLQLNAPRVGGGFFWPVLVGMGATALRTAVIKRVRVIPLLFLLVVFAALLGYWASHGSTPLPVPVAVHRRVLFDAIGILVGMAFGSRFLMFFAGTEGVASVRMQTELSLAHGIQSTLVPTVSFQNASFELSFRIATIHSITVGIRRRVLHPPADQTENAGCLSAGFRQLRRMDAREGLAWQQWDSGRSGSQRQWR